MKLFTSPLLARALAGVALLALLGGCASVPAPPPAPRDGSPAPPRPAPSPLAGEQRFLEDWFKGTPVAITSHSDGTLAVDVPLANSFEPGRSAIKPALAAVLERVATSLRRQANTRLSVNAPPDADGALTLARERAAKVRDHLAVRGIATTRISTAGVARSTAVQMRMALVAAPITRLDDASLPVPAGAVVKPASAPGR